LRPTNDATVVGTDLIAFYWEQSADEGTGLMDYKLLVDGETAATVLPSPFVSSTTDLALGKRAYASSTSHGRPSEAVDGDAFNTRWASSWLDVSNPDSEWLTVDLGAVFSIKRVVIKWEAPAKNYLIQVSSDNTTWTTIFANDGCGGNETDHLSNLTGIGRYVRMQGVQRGTGYGYSIWEFQVFGLGAEWAKIMVPLGIHTWLVQVMDLAGNLRINEHGTQTIRCSAPKLHA